MSLLPQGSNQADDWFFRGFPRYLAGRARGLDGSVAVLMDAGLDVERRIFQVLFPETPIVLLRPEETLRIEKLRDGSSPRNFLELRELPEGETIEGSAMASALAKPSVDILQNRLNGLISASIPSQQLYVAPHPRRERLTNSVEVEEVATKRGFKIVHPEQLTPIEIITTIASATSVIIAQGSMAFLGVLARPGTHVIVCSNGVTDLTKLSVLLRAADVQLLEIFGTRTDHRELGELADPSSLEAPAPPHLSKGDL